VTHEYDGTTSPGPEGLNFVVTYVSTTEEEQLCLFDIKCHTTKEEFTAAKTTADGNFNEAESHFLDAKYKSRAVWKKPSNYTVMYGFVGLSMSVAAPEASTSPSGTRMRGVPRRK
jgi:hypothetical protein